ncbi:MAG TPA: hypothetical protein VGC77_10830 [Rhodopseudomonas sp.]|uniref:hypothetical protein n=1 Tax=Rhodopseudomonas sp. TaxID=1078 RepID=UPI002ED970F9
MLGFGWLAGKLAARRFQSILYFHAEREEISSVLDIFRDFIRGAPPQYLQEDKCSLRNAGAVRRRGPEPGLRDSFLSRIAPDPEKELPAPCNPAIIALLCGQRALRQRRFLDNR